MCVCAWGRNASDRAGETGSGRIGLPAPGPRGPGEEVQPALSSWKITDSGGAFVGAYQIIHRHMSKEQRVENSRQDGRDDFSPVTTADVNN